MMSTNYPKNPDQHADCQNQQYPFDNIEDKVIGVGSARIDGEKYVLDDVVDENPMGGARMVAFVTFASGAFLIGLVVAGVIKIFH